MDNSDVWTLPFVAERDSLILLSLGYLDRVLQEGPGLDFVGL